MGDEMRWGARARARQIGWRRETRWKFAIMGPLSGDPIDVIMDVFCLLFMESQKEPSKLSDFLRYHPGSHISPATGCISRSFARVSIATRHHLVYRFCRL